MLLYFLKGDIMSFGTTTAKLGKKLAPHVPDILTATACIGVGATAVMCGKNTLAAHDILKAYDEENPDATTKDRVLKAAPAYIPTIILATATIACIIGARTTSAKQTAALASAYTIATEAAARYRDKVIEVVGEEKAKEVDEKIADEQLKAHPLSEQQPIVVGTGKVLCFDSLSSRYFMSDMETLRKVQNDMNRIILDDMYASLNDFYYRIGLDPMNLGEELGWTIDSLIDLKFTSRLSEDGQPCLVVNYESSPRSDFYRKY